MGDVALAWSDQQQGDIVVGPTDLATDEGLQTAVLISLFSDRRVSANEELPAGEDARRGWWGDTFADDPNDRIGSRLWLLHREKQLASVIDRANEYAREALQWLIDDRVARRVDVNAENTTFQRLDIEVTIYRPNGSTARFRFGSAWANEAAS